MVVMNCDRTLTKAVIIKLMERKHQLNEIIICLQHILGFSFLELTNLLNLMNLLKNFRYILSDWMGEKYY